MPNKYKQLSLNDREMIAILKARGETMRGIARIIGRDPSTLSRELKRNAPSKNKGYYLGHKAQERANNRKIYTHKRERLKNRSIQKYVEEKLIFGWSPEQISGRIKKDSIFTISHEAIYQYIYKEDARLVPFLARRHKKRYPKHFRARKHTKAHIPNRTGIEYRPKHIEDRKELGHWEADTAYSRKSKVSLQVATERKTRLTKIYRLNSMTANEVVTALSRMLSDLPSHTITYDNGKENTKHEKINELLGTKSYFCAPYHSWEKGTVENTIGLIRRFLPKKTDFSTVTTEQLEYIEDLLNNRPRKCLDFNTPLEVFKELSVALNG